MRLRLSNLSPKLPVRTGTSERDVFAVARAVTADTAKFYQCKQEACALSPLHTEATVVNRHEVDSVAPTEPQEGLLTP